MRSVTGALTCRRATLAETVKSSVMKRLERIPNISGSVIDRLTVGYADHARKRLTLPFPPSIGSYWRANTKAKSGQRLYLTKKAREYRKRVAEYIEASGAAPISYPVFAVVVYRPPDARLRDHDNYGKALWDALEHGGAIENDALVRACCYVMASPVSGGVTEVDYWELT